MDRAQTEGNAAHIQAALHRASSSKPGSSGHEPLPTLAQLLPQKLILGGARSQAHLSLSLHQHATSLSLSLSICGRAQAAHASEVI